MAAKRGVAHHYAKLNNDTVAEMRKRYLAGGISYLDLAIAYDVGTNTARLAVTGGTWKDAPFPPVGRCGHCKGTGRSV